MPSARHAGAVVRLLRLPPVHEPGPGRGGLLSLAKVGYVRYLDEPEFRLVSANQKKSRLAYSRFAYFIGLSPTQPKKNISNANSGHPTYGDEHV